MAKTIKEFLKESNTEEVLKVNEAEAYILMARQIISDVPGIDKEPILDALEKAENQVLRIKKEMINQ